MVAIRVKAAAGDAAAPLEGPTLYIVTFCCPDLASGEANVLGWERETMADGSGGSAVHDPPTFWSLLL